MVSSINQMVVAMDKGQDPPSCWRLVQTLALCSLRGAVEHVELRVSRSRSMAMRYLSRCWNSYQKELSSNIVDRGCIELRFARGVDC